MKKTFLCAMFTLFIGLFAVCCQSNEGQSSTQIGVSASVSGAENFARRYMKEKYGENYVINTPKGKKTGDNKFKVEVSVYVPAGYGSLTYELGISFNTKNGLYWVDYEDLK